MKDILYFNIKTGQLGLKRYLGSIKGKGNWPQEWGSNHAIIPVDPVTFKETHNTEHWQQVSSDWKQLSKNDPRVQYVALFKIVYDADWSHTGYSDGDDIVVDEAFIENEHDTFESIRRIFE